MEDTPNIDWLREEVNKLKSLLDDPHPGLSTWNEFYISQVKKLMNFWNAEKPPNEVNSADTEKISSAEYWHCISILQIARRSFRRISG